MTFEMTVILFVEGLFPHIDKVWLLGAEVELR